jgi:hypothetical protein
MFWLSVLAALLMIVGALGTWATAFGIVSVPGTRGEDGWVVLGAGVVGLIALWSRMLHDSPGAAALAVLCGIVGGGVSGFDLHKVASVGTTSFLGEQVHLVHPEWGLYLAVGASVALTCFAVAFAIMGSRSAGTRTIGIAVVLVAFGAVEALTHIGVEGSHAASQETESSGSALTTESNEAASTAAIASEQVQQLLSQYQAAYSSESTEHLEALFAPSLTRKNGTHAPENRVEALATYRTQFSQLQHPTYSLSNVQITTGAGEAGAHADYTIRSQNGTVGGTIAFHLVQSGTGLQIDRLTIEPHP